MTSCLAENLFFWFVSLRLRGEWGGGFCRAPLESGNGASPGGNSCGLVVDRLAEAVDLLMGEVDRPSQFGGVLVHGPDEELDLEVDPWDHVVQVGGVKQECPEWLLVGRGGGGRGGWGGVCCGGEEARLPERSTMSLGSSSAQPGSLGWDTDWSSPISSLVSGSLTGMNRVSRSVALAAHVTSSTGSIGPSAANREPMVEFLGCRIPSTSYFLRAAIHAVPCEVEGRWRKYVSLPTTLSVRSSAVW